MALRTAFLGDAVATKAGAFEVARSQRSEVMAAGTKKVTAKPAKKTTTRKIASPAKKSNSSEIAKWYGE